MQHRWKASQHPQEIAMQLIDCLRIVEAMVICMMRDAVQMIRNIRV